MRFDPRAGFRRIEVVVADVSDGRLTSMPGELPLVPIEAEMIVLVEEIEVLGLRHENLRVAPQRLEDPGRAAPIGSYVQKIGQHDGRGKILSFFLDDA